MSAYGCHLLLLLLLPPSLGVEGGALPLTTSNIDQILVDNQLVLINFYADWCRFSNLLAPIWDESADKLAAEMPDAKVVIAKVDCDKETELSGRYHVTKYPTIKYVQNGQVAKKEYRGQRSADSILDFVREQVKNPVKEWDSKQSLLDQLDDAKHHVIGYFQSKESERYQNFQRLARLLKDNCDFLAGFAANLSGESEEKVDTVHYRPSTLRTNEQDEEFLGSIDSYDELTGWATEKCSPLVREITFQNAEELTEEGLPFLILFHEPTDTASLKEYYEIVKTQLMSEKGNVNFLTADGNQFAHPLHHLGKSKADLPLLAIDSFRHMYLFPKFEDARTPGKLKKFIEDLHSGKLHREFHYGPDPAVSSTEGTSNEEVTSQEKGDDIKTKDKRDNQDENNDEEEEEEEKEDEGVVKEDEVKHFPRAQEEEEEGAERSRERRDARQSTDPPESQFVLLGPSRNRYTILKDEF